MDILTVFSNILNPECLMLILIGVIMGNIFGCIPGLNTPIAVALVLPVSFALETIPALCLIMGIYMGGVSGGLVSAVLLKIPGTAASVATTFDGYPMAMNGKATEALSYGAFASLFGGLFSAVFLLVLAPFLSQLAIGFGPWEYFGTAVLSLCLVCTLMKEKMLKAFIAMFLGLLLNTVGMSPVDGVAARFTFGNYNLENGFNLIVIIIGIFALPEILYAVQNIAVVPKPVAVQKKWIYVPDWKVIKANFGVMIRGSVIGTLIGILPGMGGGAASLVSYADAKKASKTPEKFGTGCAEGIFSCESANNATTGGALIPMLALGVPGDTTTAIVMGAIALHGLTAGPLLSMNQPILFRSIIFSVFVANLFMFFFQTTTIRYIAKIIEIPKPILFPLITIFCVTGVVSIRNNVFDLYYMLIFVVLGYILDKNKYPLSPFILASVLGTIIEDNMRRSIIYYGSFANCLVQPSIGTIFFYLAVLLPIGSVLLQNNRFRKLLHLRVTPNGGESQ